MYPVRHTLIPRRLSTTLAFAAVALTAVILSGCVVAPPANTPATATQPPVATVAPSDTVAPMNPTATPVMATPTTVPEPTATPVPADPPAASPANPTPVAPTGDPIAPPDRCRIENQKIYLDQAGGICFAYPERFTQGEFSPGQPGIFGPALDNSPEPVMANLTVEVKDVPAGSDLAQLVDAFVAEQPKLDPGIERTALRLDDEQAFVLENVPGLLQSRHVMALHGGRLIHLTFNPTDIPIAQSDVDQLFRMVTSSFVFLPLPSPAAPEQAAGLGQPVEFKEGGFTMALPVGWTANLVPAPELPPGETPLGTQYEIRPTLLTANSSGSNSFVIIASPGELTPAQIVSRLCSGGCYGSPEPKQVNFGVGVQSTRYAFPIGLGAGKQQIGHEWYIVEQNGKTVVLSVVDPRTYLTLDAVLATMSFEPPKGGGAEAWPEALSAFRAARAVMAAEQSIDPAAERLYTIQPLGVKATQWPDACLGVPVPGRACAQSVTPGYMVVLQLRHQALGGSVTCAYRTNASGSLVLRADDACSESATGITPALAEVRIPASGDAPGLILAVPFGWQQLAPDLAWEPAMPPGTGVRIGLNSMERKGGVEPTSILPSPSVMQGAERVELIWGEATAYTLEVSDPAASDGKAVAVEKHIVVLTSNRIYDFYASARTAESLVQVQEPLDLLLRLAVPLY